MNDDLITVSDYIKPDVSENAEKYSKEELRIRMEEHRGVECSSSEKIYIRSRIFADYILRRRVDLKRLDSNKKYIKNQKTNIYESLSDTILKRICMEIMDELDNELYDHVNEHSLMRYIDIQAKTYHHLNVSDRHILFPNGFYDLTDMEFHEGFEIDTFVTYMMGFEYDPDAQCPVWLNALKQMFPDDTEAVMTVVQEIMGYTFLYDSAPADTLFLLYGKGRNGKSIFNFVLRKLHGEDNVAGVPLNELCNQFALSAVYGKRVCICPEHSQEKLLNTATLKALTGRDAVKVEEKYETPFTAVFNTKIIINSNHYLRTDDTSVGFWERILPVLFSVTFLHPDEYKEKAGSPYFSERDTHLEEKLEKELPGIFVWAIEGLCRLKKNGYSFSKSQSVINLKNEMMQYCKPVLAFVIECVRQGNLDKKSGKRDIFKSSMLHDRFLAWAEDKTLEVSDYRNPRVFRKAFLEALQEQGIIVTVRKKSVDYYIGIIVCS